MSETSIAADQLRLLIERIERLEEEKKGIAEDIRDVYGEAKATGWDVPTMRKIVQLRKMEKNDRLEADALLATYKAALGMDDDGISPAREARISPASAAVSAEEDDALYGRALLLVTTNGSASTSWLQRQMRIGYNQAARLIERMEASGAVSAPDARGARTVLMRTSFSVSNGAASAEPSVVGTTQADEQDQAA